MVRSSLENGDVLQSTSFYRADKHPAGSTALQFLQRGKNRPLAQVSRRNSLRLLQVRAVVGELSNVPGG